MSDEQKYIRAFAMGIIAARGIAARVISVKDDGSKTLHILLAFDRNKNKQFPYDRTGFSLNRQTWKARLLEVLK